VCRRTTPFTLDHVVAVLEANVAGEHKEELVLILVRMKRRGEPLAGPQLEGGETTLGLVSGRSQDAERSVKPEGLAVVGPSA